MIALSWSSGTSSSPARACSFHAITVCSCSIEPCASEASDIESSPTFFSRSIDFVRTSIAKSCISSSSYEPIQ